MPKDLYLIAITIIAIIVSVIIDRKKTAQGIRKGLHMLIILLPQFLMLIIFVSVFITLMPQETLTTVLGQQTGSLGVAVAACLGSVALVPGPIAFPLAGMLAESGVSLTVIAVFITTLMMVGVLTFPVEKVYLGVRLAIFRNLLSFVGAIFIGILVGGLL